MIDMVSSRVGRSAAGTPPRRDWTVPGLHADTVHNSITARSPSRNQASLINFVEYNWGLRGLPGSADQILAGRDRAAGLPFDLAGLFSFSGHGSSAGSTPFLLDPSTGQPTG
jgi:hypothetical protein